MKQTGNKRGLPILIITLFLVVSIAFAGRRANRPERLKIIRGNIEADGLVSAGAEFTVQRESTGVYLIEFDRAFRSAPTVTASPLGAAAHSGTPQNLGGSSTVESVTPNSARIYSWWITNDSEPMDRAFGFIAAGPG